MRRNGMAMALVYIEPITDNMTASNTEAATIGTPPLRATPKQAGRDALLGAPGAGGSGGAGEPKPRQPRQRPAKKKTKR